MMLNQSIGVIIILLKIACVSTRADDEATDSRTYNVDWIVKKEFKLIFDEASWYAANKFCIDSGMQLASIDSYEEHQHIEQLIKDKYMVDEPFWISQSMTAIVDNAGSMESKPSLSPADPSNRCISWYWTNAELCCALWPLANEWSHEDCGEEKYFICQQTHKSETEMFKMIQKELLTLMDEAMFTEFAVALPTTTESTWFSLVEGALQTWLEEQHQISESTTLLEEQINFIATDFAQSKKTFKTDELRRFVETKFERLDSEHRVELLSERFRQFIGDSFVKLHPGSNRHESPSGDDVSALVKKVSVLARAQEIKLASEKFAKISKTGTTDVLDEDFMKWTSQQLLKFSEHEFESYVMDVFAQLEVYGVEEVDMNTLYQLYLLVRQELLSLTSKTVVRTTSQERIEITSDVVARILDGKQLIDDDSVFGQIFVIIATGTTVLLEEKSIHILDDKILRKFVKQEVDGLHPEDLLKLKYEGYVKIIMDELIKLVGDINLVKNESGELLLTNVVDLIATQFLLYAENEMKILADRMTQSIEKEANKLQEIIEQTKSGLLSAYDDSTLARLIQLIEQELGKIVIKTLAHFTDQDRMNLAEEGLSKILAEDQSIGRSSIYAEAFADLANKLSKMPEGDVAAMRDDELTEWVKSELENENYAKNIKLFEEVYMHVIAEEFVELIEDGAVMLSAHEQEKHQYGEMVKLVAGKLHEIAYDYQ